jgi:hypothetical protein
MHRCRQIALNTCEESAEVTNSGVGGEIDMATLKNFVFGLVLTSLIAVQPLLPAHAAGTDGTIYDPQILVRMKFAGEQLASVKKILDQSEARIVEVFAKYKINPKAKPVFDQLRAASTELQAIESWEKGQMKQVLNKSQYADYLEIQQATTAAVIKATRDD